MAWHTLPDGPAPQDVDAFEADALKRFKVDFALVPPRYRTTYFAHIWGGGYSAGYYAYLWSEVLAHDAFQWFEENGGMTRQNGERFREMILSRGHTQEMAPLYRAFRGRDPERRAAPRRARAQAGAQAGEGGPQGPPVGRRDVPPAAVREPRFVVVGNPENRRVTLFQAALARAEAAPARVVSWIDLLTGRDALERAVTEGAIVRFESPGEDFAVEREILAIGAGVADEGEAPQIAAEAARQLPEDRGLILHPRQWYLGFREALRRCARALDACPPHARLNDPFEIAVMFDKRLCHAACEQGGVPVPRALGPVRSYDELRARMEERGIRRVFVKLSCGSSASGVVALQVRAAGVEARTSVELVRRDGAIQLYNALRLRRYTEGADVRAVVDRLAAEGVHVEEWIPKAAVGGRTFDLRVVVIAGAARHVVVRTSPGPITNLHLGNRRGDVAEAREHAGADRWTAALRAAEQAALLFPGARYAGVDLVIASSLRRHAVLEINAFGDLLPGVLDGGKDTYAAEIAACSRGAA